MRVRKKIIKPDLESARKCIKESVIMSVMRKKIILFASVIYCLLIQCFIEWK